MLMPFVTDMNTTDTLDRLSTISGHNRVRPPQCPVEAGIQFDDVQLVPIEDETFEKKDAGLCAAIELILKDRPRLHRLIRVPRFQSLLVGRLLAISLASFVLFGLTMSL